MIATRDVNVTRKTDQPDSPLLGNRISWTDTTREPSPSGRSQSEVSLDPRFLGQSQDDLESCLTHQRSISLHLSDRNPSDNPYGNIDLFKSWFPEVDPKPERSQTWRTWSSRQDVLLSTATATCILVLLVNLVVTIVTQVKYKLNRGVAPIYEGNCSFVKRIDSWVHVFINILSSLLLAASNLCMQITVAPTRPEIDKAHKAKKWLDIGVPSWRNLTEIELHRTLTWVMLGLSSIPLHFMYNSAVSVAIPRYSYAGAVVSESFLHGAPWVSSGDSFPWSGPWTGPWPSDISWDPRSALENLSSIALDSSKATNLTRRRCLEIYADAFGDRTNMLIVTEDDPTSTQGSLLEYAYLPAAWRQGDIYWPCLNGSKEYDVECDRLDKANDDLIDHWTKFGRKVLFCVKEKRVENHCRLNYSPMIMIVVSCCSFFKTACVLGTAIRFRRRPAITLCTLGDAISSFLEDPDPYTKPFVVSTKASLEGNKGELSDKSRWDPESRQRWFSAASRRRWAFTIMLFLVALITAISTHVSGVHGTMERMRTQSYSVVLNTKFGTPNPTEFTAYFLDRSGTKGFFQNVLWANYWQMIISLLYLAYNALLTCQLVAEEWSGFASERKTLRLSHPRGIQRSSYFVSLPMKYGVPLLAANATLHWLVSQSLFLVNTTSIFPNGEEDVSNSYVTTGYSISATLWAIVFGSIMVILLILNSLRKLPPGMPLVSTNSLAISAACHRPACDSDARLLPVKWGVVPSETTDDLRCTFTTHRGVREPKSTEILLSSPLPSPPPSMLATIVASCRRALYAYVALRTGWLIERGSRSGKVYAKFRKEG